MESIADWERPISHEEQEAIEAACDSAASLIKRRRRNCAAHDEFPTRDCRRLPNWETRRSSSASKQVNLKVRYPAIRFGGRIVYGRTIVEVEEAAMELLEVAQAKGKSMDEVTLGFDIEWRPIFRKGYVQRKAAVMQICVDASHCFVMHIIHSGIPPILQSLLEDPKYVKVGLGIGNDAIKIWKDYNVCIKALEDLSSLANLKLSGTPKNWSLASLTERLTCQQLEKPNKIRLGNWEVNALSKEQLQYAATDAFASWHLFQILRSFPDVVSDQNMEQGKILQT